MLEQVIAQIRAQQEGAPEHIVMMGEQLADICRAEPQAAELVAQDLENAELSLNKLAECFKKYADKHVQDRISTITPRTAEQLIRKFYGLGERGAAPERAEQAAQPERATPVAPPPRRKPISFLDLLAKEE